MKSRLYIFFLLISVMLFTTRIAFSQELTSAQEMCLIVVSKIDVPEIVYVAQEPPKYWQSGIQNQIGFSDVSLTNWANGGVGNITLNAYVDANANYAKDKIAWENRMKMAYGFVRSKDKDKARKYSKSNDLWNITSKFGYKALNKLYISSTFTFRTQFTTGFTYNSAGEGTLVSSFLAPGYVNLGVGIDYKPVSWLSLNLAPLSGGCTFVTLPELREKYGNKPDQPVRPEFGATFVGTIKKSFKRFKVESKLNLFSDYLNNPQNIQVYWDLDTGLNLHKYFSLSFRLILQYDDKIKILGDDGLSVPRLQVQNVLGFSFTYTIGQYVKEK